ncbi:hypothetical protein ABT215_11305 [Streptomyces sp900105755]|uniref:hypothetical protein n=1 Tax=Streptomyces sp. 900105755 TaxID=3154389 RepID=UPI003332740A
MSLSPTALEALRAAQTAFTVSEADVFEDALSRGLEAADREGRIVGAFQAQELALLEQRVAELQEQLAQALQVNAALKQSAKQFMRRGRVDVPADAITRTIAPTQALREPEGEFHSFLHHDCRPGLGHDLPETGGLR